MEEWRPLPGFGDRYAVSDRGRVWSLFANKEMATHSPTKGRGYRAFKACVDCRLTHVWVHRAVLLAFCGAAPPGTHASHLNGNDSDNRLENLSWETPRENNARKAAHGTAQRGERHGLAKLTPQCVLEIRHLLAQRVKQRDIARLFNVAHSQISSIASGRTWGHV